MCFHPQLFPFSAHAPPLCTAYIGHRFRWMDERLRVLRVFASVRLCVDSNDSQRYVFGAVCGAKRLVGAVRCGFDRYVAAHRRRRRRRRLVGLLAC